MRVGRLKGDPQLFRLLGDWIRIAKGINYTLDWELLTIVICKYLSNSLH